MKPILEAPRSGQEAMSLTAFERRESVFSWNWHYHSELELTWICEGHGTRLVGDESSSYGPGDLVLLGSNLPHTWVSDPASSRNRATVIQFRQNLFPEELLQLPQFVSIARLLHTARRGIHFPANVAERLNPQMRKLTRLSDLSGWLGLVKLLEGLASTRSWNILASKRYQHQRSLKLHSRLERVTEYLEKHCREEVSLAQAARIAGLTPSAFSRFFHKMTQRTFSGYRNTCRIREACRMLDETDLSITEIAFACGFGNLSNFNRRFREEKHLNPREYRRHYNPTS